MFLQNQLLTFFTIQHFRLAKHDLLENIKMLDDKITHCFMTEKVLDDMERGAEDDYISLDILYENT